MSTFSKNQNFECAPIRRPPVMMERTVKWNPSRKIESAPFCPRCASSKTKFCYYNNYSISQPRYFCKSCRRYWTKGGSLRNVPVGGGCRKGRRLHTPASTQHGGASTTSTTSTTANESAEREGTDSSNNNVLEYEKEMDLMSGGDDRLHECFDGQDFVYKNDELENILGTDHNLLWSDEGTSNLPSFGFQEDFDLLSNIGDDDQLTISPNNNLVISDNWGLIDNADWL